MRDEMLNLAKKVVPGNEDKIASVVSAIKIMSVECDDSYEQLYEWFASYPDFFEETEPFVKQCLLPSGLRRVVRNTIQENWIMSFEGPELSKYLFWLCHMGLSAIWDNFSPTNVMYQMLAFVPLESVDLVLTIVGDKETEYANIRKQTDRGHFDVDYFECDEEKDTPIAAQIADKMVNEIEEFEAPFTSNFLSDFRSLFRRLTDCDHKTIKDRINSKLYYCAVLYADPDDRKKIFDNFSSEEKEQCYNILQELTRSPRDEEVLCDFLRYYNHVRSE